MQGPIAQTVKQVQAAFDALLDIAAAQQQLDGGQGAMDSMLEATARDLLAMGDSLLLPVLIRFARALPYSKGCKCKQWR